MYILGLNCYAHSASCTLIKDGQIRFSAEEERYNREKYSWKFPQKAIERCLAFEGITIKEINQFTFYWDPRLEILGNGMHFLRYFPQSLQLFKASSSSGGMKFFPRLRAMTNIGKMIQTTFHLDNVPQMTFVEHHLAHAASAFFVSSFDNAAILTMDGRGESTTTLLAVGRQSQIKKLKEIPVPHSLGHLYAAITDYLGFKPFFDEWKVMGMSAYGTDRYVALFEDVIHLQAKGGYRLNLKYFKFHTHGQDAWVSDYFIKKFGPIRYRHREDYDQRHFDIAYALQRIVEKAGVHVANHLYEITKLPALCMTGGVVLNCLMNKKIIEQTPFREFFFQPIATDAGTSLGSALYLYHQILGQERRETFDSIYLGEEYSNQAIERLLCHRGIHYHHSENIARDTAQSIAQGKIVGWFQGRMEAGPRALGNRSIVADPTDPTMKDRLNARVKRREYFRPFAPSVLEERVFEYFDMPKGQLSPYMILVGDVKEEKKSVIPAVTHADGTARVQTVSQTANPRYWQLIHEFEKIKGVPVVLNTSFNENEPIVCTPEDALNCFLRTDFDIFAIGDYIILKNENGNRKAANVAAKASL